MKLEFKITGGDFNQAGKASSKIKSVLRQIGIDPVYIKRVVVATYEAEVNVVAHAYEGIMIAEIEKEYIKITIIDKGPGIEDVERAMEAGYSTASAKVREMGFGAGMGLPNIKKNTDEMNIDTKIGEGTTLVFKIYY